MVFKRAQAKIDSAVENPRWRELFETEYSQFKKIVAEWQQLQMERVQQSRQKLVDVIDQSALEKELKMQRKRVTMLTAQFYG